jgi:hypothetical protein
VDVDRRLCVGEPRECVQKNLVLPRRTKGELPARTTNFSLFKEKCRVSTGSKMDVMRPRGVDVCVPSTEAHEQVVVIGDGRNPVGDIPSGVLLVDGPRWWLETTRRP